MVMEGEPSRGFERILARLDDAVRERFCSDALQQEMSDLQSQLRLCVQAMDHARQVHEATRSLIANAATPIQLATPTVAQALVELKGLGEAVATAVGSLTEPVRDRIEQRQAEPIKQEADTGEEMAFIAKTRSILTKKKRETWFSDALEMARNAVRVMATNEAPVAATNEDYTPQEEQVFEVFKLLRKTLVKHIVTHADELRTFRKLVRRLARKRPVFQLFHERCEVFIADKLGRAGKTAGTAPSTAPEASTVPPTATSKKRKLSETSDASATASVPRNVLDIRSKAQLCSSKASALGDVFTLSTFDVCLKLMIEVVNALTPQFSGEDTEPVASTLAVLVEAAGHIKTTDKRVDRLVCLESLLSVLVSSERVVWAVPKQATEQRLAECRQTIESLRRQPSTHTPSLAATTGPQPTSKTKQKTRTVAPQPAKKKSKPQPTHKRFDDDS